MAGLYARIWVTQVLLTDTRFCVRYIRMNHCEAHLMITSRVIDSKGPRMVSCGIFADKKSKIANVMLKVLDGFSLVDIPTQILLGLLTFIGLPILEDVLIYRRCFLFLL